MHVKSVSSNVTQFLRLTSSSNFHVKKCIVSVYICIKCIRKNYFSESDLSTSYFTTTSAEKVSIIWHTLSFDYFLISLLKLVLGTYNIFIWNNVFYL